MNKEQFGRTLLHPFLNVIAYAYLQPCRYVHIYEHGWMTKYTYAKMYQKNKMVLVPGEVDRSRLSYP